MIPLDTIVRIIGFVIHPLTVMAVISPFVSPHIFWWVALPALFSPFLVGAEGLLFAYLLLRKKKDAYIPALVLVLSLTAIPKLVAFRLPNANTEEGGIRVVSYNLQTLWALPPGPEGLESVKEFFKEADPDVVCIQEASSRSDNGQALSHFISKTLGLNEVYRLPGNNSLITYSRFPIRKASGKVFENGLNGYQVVDLEIRGNLVRVFNAHLQTNKVTDATMRILGEGQLRRSQTWKDIVEVIRRYGEAVRKRADQAQLLAESLRKCPYPVIFCGDLNDTPLSYATTRITAALNDGFLYGGSGWGSTFRGALPGLRIDYLMTTPDLAVVDYEIRCNSFSDHCAVIGVVRDIQP